MHSPAYYSASVVTKNENVYLSTLYKFTKSTERFRWKMRRKNLQVCYNFVHASSLRGLYRTQKRKKNNFSSDSLGFTKIVRLFYYANTERYTKESADTIRIYCSILRVYEPVGPTAVFVQRERLSVPI